MTFKPPADSSSLQSNYDIMEERLLKLTNTVYRVLEFFPESDPLKNKAKETALEILKNPTAEKIDMLLGYLWIAKSQGWLNSVNWMIISGEYEKISTQKSAEAVLNTTANNALSERQDRILEFLIKNEKAQVMDLQTVLPGITKRTIRRDLDQLLLMGRITRMGEFNRVFYKING